MTSSLYEKISAKTAKQQTRSEVNILFKLEADHVPTACELWSIERLQKLISSVRFAFVYSFDLPDGGETLARAASKRSIP